MKPIVLDATTRSLEALLGRAVTANQPVFTAYFMDTTGVPPVTEGEQNGVLNNTTAVALVSAPAASHRRLVSEISIYNADTAPVTITFQYNDNGTKRIIRNITLDTGAYWNLSDGPASTGGSTPPVTTAANDFQVGNGAGVWIKNTLAQVVTTLRTSLDSIYMAIVAPDTTGNVLTSNGSAWVSQAPAAGGGGTGANYLNNGGFDFAQRQTPGTLTTITDKKYGADRWWITRENADVQYNRNDATGETGLTSKNYGTLKKITNTGKMFMCQVLEGVNSVPLRSKTVIFQIKMKASASKTIRMGIFELATAGTIDAPPATLVTAFGANTVDPTMGANVAIVTGAQSKSVTTSWQSFSVSVTFPATSKNLICAIWTDSKFAANDTLSFAEAGLFVASSVQAWSPTPTEIDFAQCQRYYEKSYDVDIAPGDSTATTGLEIFASAYAVTGFGQAVYFYKVSKFKIPTVTPYATTGTINVWNGYQYAGAVSGSGTALTEVNRTNYFDFYVTTAALWTIGAAILMSGHFTSEAEIL